MNHRNIFDSRVLLSFIWSVIIIAAEKCDTPLGLSSQCVKLYDCPQLLTVVQQRPLPSNVITFLKKSHCGFEDNLPRVCCGPLSIENNPSMITDTQPSDEIDSTSEEDSSPAPKNKCGFETKGGLDDRVQGGQSTNLDEFPWMALLGYRKGKALDTSTPFSINKFKSGKISYNCGGALINHRYVLTAAHCITGLIESVIGKLVTVRLGEYDTRTEQDCLNDLCADPPQEIPVYSAFPHSGYSNSNKNRRDDIGLIRLSTRAKYSAFVQPICLPDSNTQIADGSEVVVSGWGKTLNERSSPVKLKLTFPIFNKMECVEKYRTKGAELTDNQICAGGAADESACKGDSGGPIMRERSDGVWESISIVSFGYGCGKEGWPGVSTWVAGYSDWIRFTLKSTNI